MGRYSFHHIRRHLRCEDYPDSRTSKSSNELPIDSNRMSHSQTSLLESMLQLIIQVTMLLTRMILMEYYIITLNQKMSR